MTEPLEERVLMAMSLKAGGSGYSGLLATDTAAVRQQKLIIDPPEPLMGSTSTSYDPRLVALRGATPGPGYDNQNFLALVEVRNANGTRLQPVQEFLVRPLGVETGFVQVRYALSGKAGQIGPPRTWLVLDEGGTEGMDTHALDFEARDLPAGAEVVYNVFASHADPDRGIPEDFLVTNDGTRTRLGPDELTPAKVSTRPVDGSVSGTVFEDFDGNGLQGPDDRPMGDVTIYLDLDRDGRPDANEPKTQTNELGGYFFDDLPPGVYHVREVVPAGYVDPPTGTQNGARIVEVAAGPRKRGQNFGNLRGATVSGFVFNDLNGDGVRERTEPPLVGATVFVDLNNNGSRESGEPSAVSTDPEGAWSIGGVAPGTRVIRQEPPVGFRQTAPGGGPHTVTLSAGGTVGGLNFGDQRLPAPRVTGVYARGTTWAAQYLKDLAAARLGVDPAGYMLASAAAPPLVSWVNVNQLVVRFDQPVIIDAADVSVQGTRGEYRVTGLALLGGMTNAYLVTLDRALAGDGSVRPGGDRVLLTVDGDAPNGVRGAGQGGPLLDGDADGTPGGDYRLRFNALPGDINHSGGVNLSDAVELRRRLAGLRAQSSATSLFCDLDGSGLVNRTDLLLLRGRMGNYLPVVQAGTGTQWAVTRRSVFADVNVAADLAL
jgi:hypothetical protein